MAIEELFAQTNTLLRELIDALNRNTGVTTDLMALRADAIEQVKGEAAPAKKPTSSKKTEGKVESRQITDSPEDRKPADDKPSDDKPSNDAVAPTLSPAHEELKKAVGDYVGFDDDPERYKERHAMIVKMFSHPAVGATSVSTVPENMIPAVLANIKKVMEAAKADAAARAKESAGAEMDLTA